MAGRVIRAALHRLSDSKRGDMAGCASRPGRLSPALSHGLEVALMAIPAFRMRIRVVCMKLHEGGCSRRALPSDLVAVSDIADGGTARRAFVRRAEYFAAVFVSVVMTTR